MPFQIDGRGDAFVLTSPLAGVMLLTRRQPFFPSAAHDKFFSICTAFGGYTEFGIVPFTTLFVVLLCSTRGVHLLKRNVVKRGKVLCMQPLSASVQRNTTLYHTLLHFTTFCYGLIRLDTL